MWTVHARCHGTWTSHVPNPRVRDVGDDHPSFFWGPARAPPPFTFLPAHNRGGSHLNRKRCPCGRSFYPRSGRQRYCSLGCPARKKPRPAGVPSRVVFPPRECDYCGREFRPKVSHQRFCCFAHQQLGRRPEERVLYHNREHRTLRKWWTPIVAEGGVICTGPNGCGKPIHPDERWDLGHLPGGARAPQHARCNRKTAGKRRSQGSRIW